MLTKNYADGIKVYDEIENQALEMADVMSQGIINQFPEIFFSNQDILKGRRTLQKLAEFSLFVT